MKPNNKTAATKNQLHVPYATGIQCVHKLFTFYSVILFISLHNSPLKYMCIILAAHPNAISRGDGHFLNCPRVCVCARICVFVMYDSFFLRVFHFVHLLRSECLCVRARVLFFLSPMSRNFFYLIDYYHIDKRNGASSRETFDRNNNCPVELPTTAVFTTQIIKSIRRMY